jgi:thermitase
VGLAQWSLLAIGCPEAWKISRGSRDVLVAILDTGAWNHPQLSPNLWRNAPGDSMYHGTHINGIIGAATRRPDDAVSGVSPIVSIQQFPFIGSDGAGRVSDAVRGIVCAVDGGARVISACWGTYEPHRALLDAVRYAEARGVLIVAAAGNDGEGASRGNAELFPAAFDCENLISVAATDEDNLLAAFSNRGAARVDLGAPGVHVLSTFNPLFLPVCPYWYYELSGTSVAAAHVTGAIALLYSVNPELDWRELRSVLLSTATRVDSLQGQVAAGGVLNVAAAVREAAELRRTRAWRAAA